MKLIIAVLVTCAMLGVYVKYNRLRQQEYAAYSQYASTCIVRANHTLQRVDHLVSLQDRIIRQQRRTINRLAYRACTERRVLRFR